MVENEPLAYIERPSRHEMHYYTLSSQMLFHTPPFTEVCQNGTALDDAIVSKANSINLDTGVYSDSRETASNEDLI